MRKTFLLPFALWLPVALPARAEEEAAKSPWNDAELIQKRMNEAIPAVEKACGAKFVKLPEVRISTAEELEKILVQEMKTQLEGPQGAQMKAALEVMSNMLIAKYDTLGHVIHLAPTNVDNLSKALEDDVLKGEDVLRVILAHECTHALDFERFPLEKERKTRITNDEMLGYGAVVEGHAQLIAERVAAGWGLSEAFDAYTRTIKAVPPSLEPVFRLAAEAVAAEVGFGYVQGLAFLKAVEAARGREGVEAALKSPPRGTREVEHPEYWLDPSKAPKEPDLLAALAPFRTLAPDEGGVKFVDQRILLAALAPVIAMLPESDREHALDGYEDGHALVGNALPSAFVQAVLLRFGTAKDAERFLAVERTISKIKDEAMKEGMIRITEVKYEEGVGEGNRRKGFRASKKLKAPGAPEAVRSAIGVEGRYVLEATVMGASSVTDEDFAKVVEAVMKSLVT